MAWRLAGTLGGALLGDWLGRRVTYCLLCIGSLGSTLLLFRVHEHYGPAFLASACLAGAVTASFYGWLPLYLPELFPTRMRATGQGFSFNFGRVLAAVGVLQMSSLMGLFGGSLPLAGLGAEHDLPGRSRDHLAGAGDMGEASSGMNAPRPAPVRQLVSIVPSVMRNRPGKRASQEALAAGMYWRALASMAATPGR